MQRLHQRKRREHEHWQRQRNVTLPVEQRDQRRSKQQHRAGVQFRSCALQGKFARWCGAKPIADGVDPGRECEQKEQLREVDAEGKPIHAPEACEPAAPRKGCAIDWRTRSA